MIDKPVEGVTTDARPHPAGKKGAKISLKETAERAWKARMSPRLRTWTMQVLADAKALDPTVSRRKKAQAILDAFRKKVTYVPDPLMGEFIATPDQLLCLDEGGLCIVGGDCDEASVTLAAALMSVGINTMIIGSSHRDPHDTPTHVFIAFEDELGTWVRMDGTTKFPVGRVPPHFKEWWVEPGEQAKESGEGDFVGMSGAGALAGAGTLAGAAHRPTRVVRSTGRLPSSRLDLIYPNIK